MEPAVSIVIPTYREEKYIGDTMNKLAEQTSWPWAEVVIADYDPDKTGNTINAVLKNCNKDILDKTKHVNVDKSGIGYARHLGCMAARGKFLVMFDADNRFLQKNAIDHLIRPLMNGYMITHCRNEIYPEDMEKWKNTTKVGLVNEFYRTRSIFHAIGMPFPYEPGMSITREAYNAVGGFKDVVWLEGPLLGLDVALTFGPETIKHIDNLLVYVSGRRAISSGGDMILDLNYNNAYR